MFKQVVDPGNNVGLLHFTSVPTKEFENNNLERVNRRLMIPLEDHSGGVSSGLVLESGGYRSAT
jgi:hypothetical protein